MKELVPIKIKILRGLVGGKLQNKYPDFNSLSPEVRGHMDWSYFIDAHGFGMLYDQKSGFGEGDEENDDPDCQFCATLVPLEFAEAAVAKLENVEIIDEEQWQHFFEGRQRTAFEIEVLDTEVLQGILARVQLEQLGEAPEPSPEILEARVKCLDPTDQDHRGIRRSEKRLWVEAKAKARIEIVRTHEDR